MQNALYKPECAYVGDVIPFYEKGKYYAFYLHDPRSCGSGVYAESTTWYLVETIDGLSFREKGQVLSFGNPGNLHNNYTGSVLRGKDGLYYAFFTAFNPELKIDGKPIQIVMVARGAAPDELSIIEGFRLTSDNLLYEPFDWRDPFVFFNEDAGCYWMLLCARKKGEGNHRGGCIALCTSDDLLTWKYEKPFYEPNMYITMECPEMFKMGKWWYLVFSTFSDRFVTHYRISEHCTGPWRIPYEDSLDCRSDYAIKTAGTDSMRMAFGWIATKLGDNDFGQWEWGGTMIAHIIRNNVDTGELRISAIPALADTFEKIERSSMLAINCSYDGEKIESNGLGAVIDSILDTSFMLSYEIEQISAEFGVFIGTDENLEEGYQLRFSRGIMALDSWPRTKTPGQYQWQIEGDVPFWVETIRYYDPSTKRFKVTVYAEKNILLVYVNDEIVLSTRAYRKLNGFCGPYVIGGRIIVKQNDILLKNKQMEELK